MNRVVLLASAMILMIASVAQAAELSAASLDQRRKSLNDLLNAQWEWTLRENPEFASLLGDKRYNDQLTDTSIAAIEKQLAESRVWLRKFEAIDTTGFSDQEALNKILMVRNLKETLDDAKFKNWEMPVNQMGGIHLDAPQLVPLLSFQTVKDYDDYIARLKLLPSRFDQNIVLMRHGIADHLMPPKFLLEKVAEQAERIGTQKAEDSPFALPVQKFPASIPPDEQARLRREVLAAVHDQVLPAYMKFAGFVKTDYAPKGRKDPGMWALPDGVARYQSQIKSQTTTDMSPEEIHQIGLKEVARIEGEMLDVAKSQGFADIKSFNVAVEANPDLKAKSRQQILDMYRGFIDAMWKRLPELFGRLPKAKLEVKPIEEFAEKESSTHYNQPAPDGSRPGFVMVNTYDATNRKTISFESTAYHEGVPGHHMQISIAQELTGLPPFRTNGGNNAYAEGWALYSERLGKEIGFYQNPYSNYGRLQDDMLRAIRLVVDTGFHYKKWTREQVVQYFHDHSAIDEVDVQEETDRYIVWPAQALGYKIGQLKILELRERAKKALGDKFDIRQFHDEVLGGGNLPLDVLEQRIDAWIASKKV